MLMDEQLVDRGRVEETLEPCVLGALVCGCDGGAVHYIGIMFGQIRARRLW